MNSRNVIAVGHSHLTSLRGGYELLEDDPDFRINAKFVHLYEEKFRPLSRWENKVVYNEEIASTISEIVKYTSATDVFASLIGSEHYIWSIMGLERRFDIALPFAPELPRINGAELIPYTTIRDFYQENLESNLGLLKHLQAQIDVKFYHILPPPPVSNEDRARNQSEGALKDLIGQYGMPDKALRYKLWLLWAKTAKEIAQEANIEVISPPTEALDQNGFLIEEFCERDAVHANSPYGALVWRKIETLLERSN